MFYLCVQYLEFLRPMLSDAEMEHTRVAVVEFIQGEGKELQEVIALSLQRLTWMIRAIRPSDIGISWS
jgi:hypothetical protein